MNFLGTMNKVGYCLTMAFLMLGVSASAQLNISFDIDAPTCDGYTNGKIVATASGGQAPYTYLWASGESNRRLYSVSEGSYSLTVTDDSGQTLTSTAVVTGPDELIVEIQGGDVCNGTGSTYTLVASGGTGPYTFKWDGNSTGASISNPDEGYHYAEVEDANGCSSGSGMNIYDPLTVFVRTQNVVCHGYCDGTVEAKIDGGTGPFTFLWSNGSTDQLVYGLDPGTYTVTVTDGNGCTTMGSGTLVEPDPITYTVSLADSCAGGTTASIVAQGGTGTLTVRWSTGTIGTSAYLPEGQHYVYIEDENGCEETERVIVSDGIESITTMVTDATCDDLGEVLLCITGGRGPFTYIWSDGQDEIRATDLEPGTYSFTAIDGGGCRYDGSVVVDGPTPAECNQCDADAGTLAGGITTDSICNGNSIDLLATIDQAPVVPSGFQVIYVLTTDPSNTIVGVNATPMFTVTTPGNYTLHTLVYDPTTLDLSIVVIGTTMAADVLTYINSNGICASLDVPGTSFFVPECVDPFSCEGSPGSLSAVPVCFDGTSATLSPDIVVAPDVPVGYTLIYLLIQNDIIIAYGANKDFNVDAIGNYSIRALLFEDGTFDPVSAIQVGTSLIADISGILPQCGNLSSVDDGADFLVEEFTPTFSDGLQDPICPTDSVQLNPGGSPDYAYEWTPASGLSNPNIANPMALLDDTTTFMVTITQMVNGSPCSVVRPYEVNVAPLPSLVVPSDIITCNGENVDLNASVESGTDVTWSDQPDFSNVLSNDPTYQVASGEMTTYYVLATNAAGCTRESQVSVGDFPVEALLGDDYTICEGDEAQIAAEVVNGSADNFDLFGSDGALLSSSSDGSFLFVPSNSEGYIVVASNSNGCTDTSSINIDLSAVDVELLAGMTMDTSIYPGMEVDLDAISNGAITFEFDPDPSYITTGDSTATVMPTETTTYAVTGTDEYGCTATSELVVEVLDFVCDRPYLFVPNAFSPDGDGINDVFYIDGVNVRESFYTIYNRWGELVFESTVLGPEDGWDGYFNGQLVDPDVYGIYVRIICNDGDEFFTQGNVTVLR